MSDIQWIIDGLKKPGKTQVGLAAALGRAPSAISSLLKGTRLLKAREVPIVRAYLEAEPAVIVRPEGPEESEVKPAPDAPPFSQLGDYDIAVRGIAVGGDDDEFYFNGEVIEYVRRPPGLARKKNVFAVHVTGDSMFPRYEAGDLIYAQHAPPVAGEDVLVELRNPEDENMAGKSFVKTLVRRSASRIICRQFNPDKEIEFDTDEVRELYKVFRNRELFG